MKKKNKISEKNAFTLAELLIVVAIIAVLVAIAIPVFSSQLEKAKAARLKANIRTAKAVAVADYLGSSKARELGKLYAVDIVDRIFEAQNVYAKPSDVPIHSGGSNDGDEGVESTAKYIQNSTTRYYTYNVGDDSLTAPESTNAVGTEENGKYTKIIVQIDRSTGNATTYPYIDKESKEIVNNRDTDSGSNGGGTGLHSGGSND